MTTVTRRLVGAALALTLLAPAAEAAPRQRTPWWQELWQAVADFRPGDFFAGLVTAKDGPFADPLGQPTASNPAPSGGPDKSGPDSDPLGQPTAQSPPGGQVPDGPAPDPLG